jgi:hypothetical protein
MEKSLQPLNGCEFFVRGHNVTFRVLEKGIFSISNDRGLLIFSIDGGVDETPDHYTMSGKSPFGLRSYAEDAECIFGLLKILLVEIPQCDVEDFEEEEA